MCNRRRARHGLAPGQMSRLKAQEDIFTLDRLIDAAANIGITAYDCDAAVSAGVIPCELKFAWISNVKSMLRSINMNGMK